MMDAISVIVPVYKVEPYIHRCIKSILGQSDPDFELILVDDGSPDSCGTICDTYAEKDSRIHVIHQQNGGLSAARNAGIDWAVANSSSQWLAFIDSDDWVHRDYLRILRDAADGDGAQISMCGLMATDRFTEDVPVCCCPESVDPETAFEKHYGMCMTACCKLYRKSLFETLRFPVGKLHEDAYTTHLPLFASEKVVVCDVPLYYYYTNPGSITRVRWTPKRLEEIEAHELRLSYLQEKGYRTAYKRELEVYADTLMEQAAILMELRKEDKSFAAFLTQLRKKLRWVLKQEKTAGSLSYDQGKRWVCLTAYPSGPVYSILRSLQKRKHSTKY